MNEKTGREIMHKGMIEVGRDVSQQKIRRNYVKNRSI